MQDQNYFPPLPRDDYERERVEHTRLRRRLLSGSWRQDLEQFLSREVGPVRLRSWGEGDRTKNVFRNVVSQLSVLYDSPPVISHKKPQAAEELTKIINDAGLWQFAGGLQQITVGLREGLYRISVNKDSQTGKDTLGIRIIPPDLVYGEADPDIPDKPIYLCEYRLREIDGEYEWTKDELSIRGDEPYFRVVSKDGKEDLSERFLGVRGGLVGENYPYYQDGEPCLPYILYHACA